MVQVRKPSAPGSVTAAGRRSRDACATSTRWARQSRDDRDDL